MGLQGPYSLAITAEKVECEGQTFDGLRHVTSLRLDGANGYHIVTRNPVIMIPHCLDKSLTDDYENVHGRPPGVMSLSAKGVNSWECIHRVCTSNYWLHYRASSEYAVARQLYYEYFCKRTKCFKDDHVDDGAIHGDSALDFGNSTWFTRTSEERKLNRDFAQLLVRLPNYVHDFSITPTVLWLGLRVFQSFGFLTLGRGEGGRSREHAVHDKHWYQSVRWFNYHNFLVDYRNAEVSFVSEEGKLAMYSPLTPLWCEHLLCD